MIYRITFTLITILMFTTISAYEEPREVVQMYYNDQRMLETVENSVLENQVVDWVVNNAKVSDKPMSFQEAINAATQAAGN